MYSSKNITSALDLAHRAATASPRISDRPSTMAVARVMTKDFNRDPVRRASDAAHGGATLTLVTGPKFGSSPQRRQTLTFSAGNWLLDSSEVISAGVAYHMLRACSQIDISRN